MTINTVTATMKEKEIIQVGVRLLGLVVLYHGLMILPAEVWRMFLSLADLRLNFALTHFVKAVWPLAVTYWLVRGAPELIRIAYPGDAGKSAGATT